jgi:hypothetical protein
VLARLRELLPDLLAARELPELPLLPELPVPRDLLLRVEPVDRPVEPELDFAFAERPRPLARLDVPRPDAVDIRFSLLFRLL